MFGCALLQNEEEETFVWLFQTWLEAMSGKLPISILTDQDRAIKNVIDKVFPTVAHRFCLWHILEKFPKKDESLYKDNSPFSSKLKNCLYRLVITEQFDSEWNMIMSKYDLISDEWLGNIFDIRQSWVPVYNRTIFYTGMNTTQRCETTHSFFYSFLNKGTTLREFVIKYEHTLEHRYIAEHEERFALIYKRPNMSVRFPIEEQAVVVYTRNMFNEFLDELLESSKLKKEKLVKNGSSTQYKVSNFRNPHEVFIVTINVETLEVSCQCHLFEFKGILCRHILYIFNKNDVDEIPSRYILPRWTKRAADGIFIPIFKEDRDAIARDLQFTNTISRLRPYLHASGEACDTIIEALDMILEKVSNAQETKEVSNVQETIVVRYGENAKYLGHTLVGDPCISKTKGCKKESVQESKRGHLRSGFEVGMECSKRSKRRCKICGEFGHYSSTCERRKEAKVVELVPEKIPL